MKFGSREICDVVFKAKSNTKLGNHTFKAGEPVLYLDTATTSSMETAATTVYAQGGKGNSRLIAWEGEKTVTFTVEDALISPKGLAILSGAGLINADGNTTKIKAHTTQVVELGTYTASSTSGSGSEAVTTPAKIEIKDFKLPETDDTAVHVYGSRAADTDETDTDFPTYAMLLDENGEMSGVAVPVKLKSTTTGSGNSQTTTYILEGDNVSLFETKDTVMLDYYVVYPSDAIQIDITPDQFAGYYYMEASTLFRRQVDGKDLPAEFIIPTAKIQSNFTFTMASTGDPSTFTFTMDAMPGYVKGDKTKKVLAAIQILGADDNWDLTDCVEENETVARYTYNINDKGHYLSGKKQTSNDTGIGD